MDVRLSDNMDSVIAEINHEMLGAFTQTILVGTNRVIHVSVNITNPAILRSGEVQLPPINNLSKKTQSSWCVKRHSSRGSQHSNFKSQSSRKASTITDEEELVPQTPPPSPVRYGSSVSPFTTFPATCPRESVQMSTPPSCTGKDMRPSQFLEAWLKKSVEDTEKLGGAQPDEATQVE